MIKRIVRIDDKLIKQLEDLINNYPNTTILKDGNLTLEQKIKNTGF